MAIAFFYVVFTALVAYIANQKGRSALAWFFVSLLASPLVGIIAMIALPSRPKAAPDFTPPSESGRPAPKSLDEYLNS